MAGEREGFSLVELIIVIAIMAILIGVIALAVIPNIQRSRESKDLTVLDTIASAANSGIAAAQITANGSVTVGTGVTNAPTDAEELKVWNAIKENMGDPTKITLGSTNGSEVSNIVVTWTVKDKDGKAVAATIKVEGKNDAGTVMECKYTDSDNVSDSNITGNDNKRKFVVISGATAS